MNNENFICTKSITPETVKEKINEVIQLIEKDSSLSYKPVIMIAGMTDEKHEFQEGNFRLINKNVCHGCLSNPDIIFDKGDWNFCPQNLNLNVKDIKTRDLDLIENYNKKILITGCGRSGTTFSSHFFQKVGFDIRHESEGKHGMVSGIGACRKYYPKDKTQEYYTLIAPDTDFDYILHQVRHPLKTISSLTPHLTDDLANFVGKIIDVKLSDSCLLRSMKHWYYWNYFAEELTDFVFKVENLHQSFDSICQYIGLPQISYKKDIVETVDPKTNTWCKYKDFGWDDLKREDERLCKKIKEKAEKYGYFD